MALHFDYASARAPTASKRPDPTATRGSSYTAPLALRFLYSFNEERSFLFALEPDDIAYLDTLGNNTANKVNYILQLGYCRAVNYFFQFSVQKVKADVEFILQHYFPGEPFPKKQVLRKVSLSFKPD
jgi:Domain of unknown function (DUF4158)